MSEFFNPLPIDGTPVEVNPSMAGCEVAVLANGRLHVSQELFDKMKAADAEEMKRIVYSVRLLNLDRGQLFGFGIAPLQMPSFAVEHGPVL